MSETSGRDRQYIQLVRHVVDDGGRTRRAALLILVLAVAIGLATGTLVTAYLITGITGPAIIGGATVAGAAGRVLVGRRRPHANASTISPKRDDQDSSPEVDTSLPSKQDKN
jgi:hypothetical protein